MAERIQTEQLETHHRLVRNGGDGHTGTCRHPWDALYFDHCEGLRCRECGHEWHVDDGTDILWKTMRGHCSEVHSDLERRLRRLERVHTADSRLLPFAACVIAALLAVGVYVAWLVLQRL